MQSSYLNDSVTRWLIIMLKYFSVENIDLKDFISHYRAIDSVYTLKPEWFAVIHSFELKVIFGNQQILINPKALSMCLGLMLSFYYPIKISNCRSIEPNLY